MSLKPLPTLCCGILFSLHNLRMWAERSEVLGHLPGLLTLAHRGLLAAKGCLVEWVGAGSPANDLEGG